MMPSNVVMIDAMTSCDSFMAEQCHPVEKMHFGRTYVHIVRNSNEVRTRIYCYNPWYIEKDNRSKV